MLRFSVCSHNTTTQDSVNQFLGYSQRTFHSFNVRAGKRNQPISLVVGFDHKEVAEPLAQHVSCKRAWVPEVVHTVVAFVDQSVHSGVVHDHLSYLAHAL